MRIDPKAGASLLAMGGPHFSSFAQSNLFRSWGCDVIGMTNMPEAKLAREAELCYASVAMVTDDDCWHEDRDHVTLEGVVRVLLDNAERARRLIKALAPRLAERNASCEAGCHHSLEAAIFTHPDARDPVAMAQLDAVAGRLLKNRDAGRRT